MAGLQEIRDEGERTAEAALAALRMDGKVKVEVMPFTPITISVDISSFADRLVAVIGEQLGRHGDRIDGEVHITVTMKQGAFLRALPKRPKK